MGNGVVKGKNASKTIAKWRNTNQKCRVSIAEPIDADDAAQDETMYHISAPTMIDIGVICEDDKRYFFKDSFINFPCTSQNSIAVDEFWND